MLDEVKRKILDYVERQGPVSLYKLAKDLGLTYGAAQWHVFWLEREGLLATFKVGNRRYVAAKPGDVYKILRVSDILSDFELTLRAFGVRPDMSLEDALKVLERKAPHIAELLRIIIEERRRGF
ncbi:MAG: winged helix-turn-helix transcriptional regulator [Thermoproteus sp. AZ2]|uniref:Winged helix-turn-helix transcriptional regulator n=1 Tax=Thermoproteus sp. AZ2 TaxID=1609232 RepID=A0ACC6V201_9CREN